MKKLLLTFILLSLLISPVLAQTEIKLLSNKKSLLIREDYPVVYRPTKLVIGQENIFQIKGEPGSYVSLAVSTVNSGAPLFLGKELRLGPDIKTKESVIPKNGLLELPYIVPYDKSLLDKILYFEVAVWKDSAYGDLKLAKILAADGRETSFNGTIFALPPKDVSKPGFSPAIPGVGEMMRTIETIEMIKSGNQESLHDQMQSDIYYNTPALLRNMNAPELNQVK